MDKHTATSALAEWKYASRMLGWTSGGRRQLQGLARGLWPHLEGGKGALLFLLDPHVPTDLMLEQCLPILAQRPAWLSKREFTLFLEAVATSPAITDEIVSQLAQKSPRFVIPLLASNYHVSPEGFRIILQKAKPAALIALSKNPFIDLETVRALAGVADTEIAANLLMFAGGAKVPLSKRYQLLQEASAPLGNEAMRFVEGAFADPAVCHAYLDQWELHGDSLALLGFARHNVYDEVVSSRLVGLGSYPIQAAIARNHQLSGAALNSLSHPFCHETIKLSLAEHPHLSLESVARLLVDDVPSVRQSVITHQRELPTGIVGEVLFDEEDEAVIAAGLTHQYQSEEYFQRALPKVQHPGLLRDMIKHQERLPEGFFHYGVNLDPSLLGYAVQHPCCPNEFKVAASASSIQAERLAAQATEGIAAPI